jgi:hypothetical protein
VGLAAGGDADDGVAAAEATHHHQRMHKSAKGGGERARPHNQWWSNKIESYIMVSQFLAPIRRQTGVVT